MPRKYDTTGRDMLRELCRGIGFDIGCGPRKIAENCIGIDHEASVEPDYVADMAQLPCDDESMDFIVSSHCLEHAPDVVKVLREWYRVLRKGASIGVIVPHGEYAIAATLGDASGTHRQLFTPDTLEIFLQHAGFTEVCACTYERPYAYQQTPGIFARGVK